MSGPGLSACQDSNNISATITSGEQATGSITGRPLNTGSLGQFTYSVTAASTDGFTGTTTNTYTVIPAPPTAMISSPLGCGDCLRYYAQNSQVPTTFSCAEGLDGPGIASCSDGVSVAVSSSNGNGMLDTSKIGQFPYSVTATSKDGETGSTKITYAVADPPTATVSSPTGTDPQFFENTPATISFSCADGAGGPGIESCGRVWRVWNDRDRDRTSRHVVAGKPHLQDHSAVQRPARRQPDLGLHGSAAAHDQRCHDQPHHRQFDRGGVRRLIGPNRLAASWTRLVVGDPTPGQRTSDRRRLLLHD